MGKTMESEDLRLSAHEALLAACTAALVNETRVACINDALNAPNIDWSALILAGLQQGVAQTTALQLRRFPDDPRIPATARAILDRIYTATAARNQVMFREAARLSQALETAGISCLILKGVGLALTVYPDPALRSFADIDLLVSPDDYDAAGEIARRCGYVPDTVHDLPEYVHRCYALTVPEEILMGTLAPEIEPGHGTPAIRSLRHQVRVEIHRTLSHLGGKNVVAVDFTPFWENCQKVDVPGEGAFLIPAPEAMLVHLAAHAYQHANARLLFPLDIALVLRESQGCIDWVWLLDLARRYEARSDLYLMLEYIRREWNSGECTACKGARFGVPDTVLADLKRSLTSDRPQQLQTDQIMHIAEDGIRVWLRLLRGMNLQQRLDLVRRSLFPTPAKMREQFGGRNLPLAFCYLLRLGMITVRIGRIGLKNSTLLRKVRIARNAR